VLSPAEEALAVCVRHWTALSLDDCLSALEVSIPNLSRSNLYRCLRRAAIARLPREGTGRKDEDSRRCVRLASVRLCDPDGVCFVAVDVRSRFVWIEWPALATRADAEHFLHTVSRRLGASGNVLAEPASEDDLFAEVCHRQQTDRQFSRHLSGSASPHRSAANSSGVVAIPEGILRGQVLLAWAAAYNHGARLAILGEKPPSEVLDTAR
jgi:5-carboxymethyl-2-hydroxymuconate isomerase